MAGEQAKLDTAKKNSEMTAGEVLTSQTELNTASLKLNMAMAWLQMAMGLTTKLSGR